jgi:hypothetical protein
MEGCYGLALPFRAVCQQAHLHPGQLQMPMPLPATGLKTTYRELLTDSHSLDLPI